MARRKRDDKPVIGPGSDPRFEGARFSNAECRFLLEHLGQPSIVALGDEDTDLPDGVNEAQVVPILDRTYQLHLYEQSQREKLENPDLRCWCGFEELKRVLQETLNWRETVQELKRCTRGSRDEIRRAAAAPSLFLWDPDTDIPYLGGIGSDAEFTQHALAEDGIKIPLYTELHESGEGAIRSLTGVAPFVRAKTQAEEHSKLADITPHELVTREYETTGVMECPICGKAEEFELNRESTKRSAYMRMMSHLKRSTVKKDQHELLHKRLQSGKAGSRENRQRVQERQEAAAS